MIAKTTANPAQKSTDKQTKIKNTSKVALRSIEPKKPSKEELKAQREAEKKAKAELKQREKEQRAKERAEQKKREKELRAWQKEQDKKNAAALIEEAKKREGANYERYSKALRAAQLFADKGEFRPVLGGVLHTANGDLIATDGYRLIWLDKVHNLKETKTIGKTGIIEGQYPEVRRLIPQPERRKAVIENVDVVEWHKAHDLLSVLVKEQENHVIRFTGKPMGAPIIEAKDLEGQTGKYTFETLHLQGDKVEITYNCEYILDVIKALKLLGVKTFSIEFYGKLSPIIFRFDGGRALVLPVRTY